MSVVQTKSHPLGTANLAGDEDIRDNIRRYDLPPIKPPLQQQEKKPNKNQKLIPGKYYLALPAIFHEDSCKQFHSKRHFKKSKMQHLP